MDEQTQNKIDEYIENLPQKIRDLISDDVWETRVSEIAKKYSLNEEQTEDLVNAVLFILTGLESPESFLDLIITDLNISRLLAEQIQTDLEKRVFEYALKKIEEESEETKDLAVEKENDIPEIRPEITPMVEEGEGVNILTPKKEASTLIIEKPETKVVPEQKMPTPEHNDSEQTIQRPVSVPRYTAVPLEEEKMNEVELTNKTETVKTPEPVTPATKSYSVDPYREPLN